MAIGTRPELKDFILENYTWLAVFGQVLGISAAIVNAFSGPVWLLATLMIVVVLALGYVFTLYVVKCHDFREQRKKCDDVISIFEKTHNTWHKYKRLTNRIHADGDIDAIRSAIHSDILSLVSNFRDSLSSLHKGHRFSVSVKRISYKNLDALDDADGASYAQIPFRLIDLGLYRDPGGSPFLDGDIIDDLDLHQDWSRR